MAVGTVGRSVIAATLSWGCLAAGSVAGAQQPGAADSLLEALQLKARLAPAPPFVGADAGRAPRTFIPPGRTGAPRAAKPMSPAELAAATAALDTARERQQRRAGRVPPPVPEKPPPKPEIRR